MKTLSSKIKKLRTMRSFSQKMMADNMNIAQSTYCRYESGEATPSEACLRKIAFLLGLSYEAFLNFDEEKLFTYIEKVYWESR